MDKDLLIANIELRMEQVLEANTMDDSNQQSELMSAWIRGIYADIIAVIKEFDRPQ